MFRPAFLPLVSLVLIMLVGCVRPGPISSPQATMDLSQLGGGAPALAPLAPGDAVSAPTGNVVQIEPEEAIGYDNLPTSATQLYAGTPQPLSLGDVIVEALANNRSIRIQGYTLRIAELAVPASRGIYDLMLSSRFEYNETEEQTAGGLGAENVVRGWQRQFEVGLAQLIPTGGTISAAWQIYRTANRTAMFDAMGGISFATNHDYEHRMILGLTQPLLRGLGSAITNADIRIAQLARAGAAADFQTALEDNLVLSLTTYWNLIGAIENWKVQVISYSAATDLLRVNRAKYEAEVIAVTDVLQAEAAAEGRRSVVISARQSVRDLEDQLTQLIFINGDRPMWGTELAPTQPIDWREIDIDLGGALATATARRAELRSATSDIAQAETRRRVARNARLPQLDVFGQIDANGQAEQNEDALDETTKHNNYAVGLEFSYPLQNRRARHALRQAETTVAQLEEAARATSDQIALEVRTAWRNLRTAREQIDVTGSQVRSEEAKLQSELRRYEVGTSTAFQVLDFQEDLAAAQSSHIAAVVAYNQAAIQLDRARGTLLDTYGVTVEDANLTPPVEPVDSFPIGSE